MEDNILGYICAELSQVRRHNMRLERQIGKYKNFSFIATIAISFLIYKVTNMNRRIKALEGENE